uniref:TRAF-type domain-containing protein n=1 Tax=Glossina austeni TaxID=7395 RepID=A0A1A9VLU3_GLOAU
MSSSNNEASGSNVTALNTSQQNQQPVEMASFSQLEVDGIVNERPVINNVGDDNNPGSSGLRMDTAEQSLAEIPRVEEESLNAIASGRNETLKNRLTAALLCGICLHLRRTRMYVCQLGHLACAPCFKELLIDAQISEATPKCHKCQADISMPIRNIAVENAILELPNNCRYCNEKISHNLLNRHERNDCHGYPTKCKYARIGCQWIGVRQQASYHERHCEFLAKTANEIIGALEALEAKADQEKNVFNNLIDLLSCEKMVFTDLQMRSYRVENETFYVTKFFPAFGKLWMIRAKINSDAISFCYQLLLRSIIVSPLKVEFVALEGPYSKAKISPRIYKHDFMPNICESNYHDLPLTEFNGSVQLLAKPVISIRIIMFLLND